MNPFLRLLFLGALLTTRLWAVNPTVAVTGPAANANIPVGSSLYLKALASDPDGFIAKVEFYVNGAFAGTVSTAPYNVVYTFGSAIPTTVVARAYDNSGATTDSVTVNVNVVSAIGEGPNIFITSPAATDTIVSQQRVVLAASATDSDGFIPSTVGAGVTFLLDGDPLPVLTGLPTVETNPDLTPPYTLTWNPGVAKTYDLRAQAVDDKGNIRLSPPLLITVNSPIPTVQIVTPLDGT
ncbi:MAG: Ig-like domain-containing protein, partial [Opitutaceae bacterium]